MMEYQLQFEYINDADAAQAAKSEVWRIQEYARRQERSLKRQLSKFIVVILARRLMAWL